MSEKTLLSIAEFGAVRQWLEAVANGHEQTGRFLSDMLDQLESLLADLVRRRTALAAEEEESRQTRRRHEEEMAGQREALSLLTADLQRMRQQWERCAEEQNAQRDALAADEARIGQERERRENELAAQRQALAAEETQSRQQWQQTLDDLKAQRESLAAQRESLTAERDALAADRQSLAALRERLVSQDGAISAPAAEPATLSLEPLQPILEDLRQGQSALREMLASGSTQTAELRDAIAHWAVSPEQLLQQVEQIAASAATAALAAPAALAALAAPAAPAAPAGPDAPAAPPPDTALAEQLHALELERTVLETELESIRNRAAETSDMLAQQTRQSTEERARWAEELKRMRHTIELLAQRPAEAAASPALSDSRPMPSKSAGGGASPADPVLDSVMAQFEMLQKDLARRRKAGASVHTA